MFFTKSKNYENDDDDKIMMVMMMKVTPAALEPLSGAGQSEFHLQVWSFTQTPLGEHL